MAEPMTDYDAAIAAATAAHDDAVHAAGVRWAQRRDDNDAAYRRECDEAYAEYARTCAAAAVDDAIGTALDEEADDDR